MRCTECPVWAAYTKCFIVFSLEKTRNVWVAAWPSFCRWGSRIIQPVSSRTGWVDSALPSWREVRNWKHHLMLVLFHGTCSGDAACMYLISAFYWDVLGVLTPALFCLFTWHLKGMHPLSLWNVIYGGGWLHSYFLLSSPFFDLATAAQGVLVI